MKLVLFGTGDDCLKCLDILRSQGIEPDYFTDNNSSKWGSQLEGKKIISPEELLKLDCQIIISTSDYQEKIISQLREMGLQDRILKFVPIFRQYIERKAREYRIQKAVVHDKESILIDAFMGSGWDGDQQYACYIASGLKERGYDVHIYAKDSLVPQSDKTELLLSRFPWKKDRYWETLLPIIKDMEQRLPFVLIANTLEHVMAAAYILKQQYPDKVRILSVIHGDNYSLYEKQAHWLDSLDLILGISERIVSTLTNIWKIPKEKVRYRVNPVFWKDEKTSFTITRSSFQCNDPIRIGWGGRLSSSPKNAHLLPNLINALEQRNVSYCMELAGDGSYYPILQSFLEKNGLKKQVRLLGRLEHHAMKEFWSRQQVYINISEWEGCCLAMLEAMECGAVPVVTNVSGTSDVVCDGLTGFKVDFEEAETMIEMIADKIDFLAKHSEKRQQMSQEAVKVVREKCDLNRYIDYMEGLLY